MIQIDMPMPKCCDECFALDDYGDYPFCLISKHQYGYKFNTRQNRMPSCPLKVQEPVEPVFERQFMSCINIYDCGKCGTSLGAKGIAKYCMACGQAVKWK